jgi:hypothetical protein
MVMTCDRGGEYINMLNLTNETRQREAHTRRTGCEFEIVCLSVKGVWAVRKILSSHNHELGGNLAGHVVKRYLNELEKAKVRAFGGQGLAPKDILCILCKEFANIHSMGQGDLQRVYCYLSGGVERSRTHRSSGGADLRL